MKRIVVLAGPTASGKSAAAVALAEAVGGEVVSCDSLAVYRELDVGTAKPTREERARVPHHLIDIVDPDEPFNAARFVEYADRAIAHIERPIVVGGTGLYLRALTDGIFDSPAPDPAIRARIQAEASAHGWPSLHDRLKDIDSASAQRIQPNDPVRIGRALEVYEQTGRPISELQRQAGGPRYHALTFVVDPPRAELEARIAARVQYMLQHGIVDEARAVAAKWGRGVKPLAAVGYKEVMAFLDGTLAEPALAEAIRVATRKLARRQRTWFSGGFAKVPGRRLPDAGSLPVDEIRAFFMVQTAP